MVAFRKLSNPPSIVLAKKSAFYPGIKLLDYLCDFFKVRDGAREFEARIGEFFDRANRHIRGRFSTSFPQTSNYLRTSGLVLETTHLDADRQLTFAAHGLTDSSARELEFERDGQRVTVEDHFREVYNYNLRYPNLRCVIHQMPQRRQSYYPLELVKIVYVIFGFKNIFFHQIPGKGSASALTSRRQN